MKRSFCGGIHPPDRKEGTRDGMITTAPLPQKVILPLSQHTGAPCEPLVALGDRVRTGQVIGRSQKFISSAIHASITGTVTAVGRFPHPVSGTGMAVVIERSDASEEETRLPVGDDPFAHPAEAIVATVKEAGIVGLGGAMFPTHVKLSVPAGKQVDTLLINGAECEPYLTCDYRLMVEQPHDIVRGVWALMRALGVSRARIGIEQNKPKAIEALRNAVNSQALQFKKVWAGKRVIVVPLKVKYPQGAEKQLIKAVCDRTIPPKGLPFDVGCVVANVGTLVAVKEALFDGKPLYERVITLAGKCLARPANLRVRIGTLLTDLIAFCGGVEDPAKVIFGGPMMGIAQAGLAVPVIKGTSGVLFLRADEVRAHDWGPCVKCGRCLDVCPMGLSPAIIGSAVEKELFPMAQDAGCLDCIECGACAYVCPFSRPLVHFVKVGKKALVKK